MKKSLIALLLVVALVVTVSVFAVSASETDPFEGATETVTADCPYCGENQTWYPVNETESSGGTLIQNWATTKAGATHFYYPKDMTAGTGHTLTTETYCINLNGKTVTRTSANQYFTINGTDAENAPVLNLMDTSAEETGTMVIPTTDNKGMGVFQISGTCGTINVYSGNYIGGGVQGGTYSTSSGTGITCTSATATATVNLMGGTLQGSSRYSSGLLNLKGDTVVTVDGCELIGKAGGTTGGVCVLANNAKLVLKSGSITGSSYTTGNNYGQAVVVNGAGATFEMSGGTLTGNTAASVGGAIKQANGTVTISGGTITGSAYGGGAIYKSGGTMTISGGTITGTSLPSSTAGNSGGSIRVKSGDLTINGGTITGGSAADANGGNIYWESTGKLTINDGIITAGTALRVPATDGGFNDQGNGGNIYMASGELEINGGTISGGLDSYNAQHAGNIYATACTLDINGGTITGGKCNSYGGNIYIYNAFTDIDADEGKTVKITNGKAGAGANLYIRETAVSTNPYTTITGPDVTISGGDDGTKIAASSATAQHGCEIMLYGVATNPCVLDLTDVTIDAVGTGSNYVHTNELVLYQNAQLNVAGEAYVDCAYINDSTNRVTVMEGYTGRLWARWFDSTITGAVDTPGAATDPTLWQEAGYVGTGTVYAVNGSRSQKILADTGDAVEADAEAGTAADNKFVVATFEGVKADDEGNITYTPIGDLTTADQYDFVKPYFEGEYTLFCDTTMDINNSVLHIITGNYKLSLIEQRTYKFEDTVGYVTVDNEANVETVVRDNANDYQYIVIPTGTTEDQLTKFTAHRVQVDIDSVSIKPATAGMYYTTNMDTTPTASQHAVSYGVILSLVEMPGADFVDGLKGEVYTEINFEEFADGDRVMVRNANSALLTGILPEVELEQNGQKTTSGKAKIYANAFICFNIDGEDVYVMADKTYDLSLLDIMQIVDADETLASHASVLKMYETWQTPMADWDLSHIKAAYEASKA